MQNYLFHFVVTCQNLVLHKMHYKMKTTKDKYKKQWYPPKNLISICALSISFVLYLQ
jgi:hypothetical protein